MNFCHKTSKRQKKWQTYKDSNLDKVNQNHLCYRYTIGLRTVHNISQVKKNTSTITKKNRFLSVVTIVKVNAHSFLEQCAFTMTNSNCSFSLTN